MSAQRTRGSASLPCEQSHGKAREGRAPARPNQERRAAALPRRAMRWAAGVVVCAAIAIGMGVWLWPAGESPAAGSCTGGVRRPAPQAERAREGGARVVEAPPAPAPIVQKERRAIDLSAEADGAAARTNAVVVGDGPERGWLVGAVTNADGGVVERWRLEDGRRMKRVLPPRRVFSHASDEIIALALSGDGASELPPMPAIGPAEEEAFRRSLATPIRDDPADDERTRETKRRVREARAEIARRMGEGETFAEVIASHVAARAELERERKAEAQKNAPRGE